MGNIPCPKCGKTDYWWRDADKCSQCNCPNCGGTGEVTIDILLAGNEHDTEQRECYQCNGTGKINE